MDDIISGASSFGRTYSTIQLIAGSVMSIVLLIVGISLLNEKTDKKTEKNKFGFIFIGVSMVVFLIGFVNYRFSQSNETYAAFNGVNGAVDVFKMFENKLSF
jgi:predicted permease